MGGVRTVFGAGGRVARLAVMAVLLQASLAWAQTVVVTSADPAVADQGTVNLDVTINGSGFARGARAGFLVSGTTSPGGVTVNSTTYRNSSKLIANITVSASATVSKYDIEVVLDGGRRGVGLERFAVEIGYALVQLAAPSGTTWLGNGPAACSETRAILRVAGMLINGTWSRDDQTATCSKSVVYYYDVVGAPASVLPAGSLPVTRPDKPSLAHAMSRDGLRVAGLAWDSDSDSGGCSYYTHAVVWEQDGSGGWTEMVLPVLPGGTGRGSCLGISDDGQIASGTQFIRETTRSNQRAVVWRRVPGTNIWDPPVDLEPYAYGLNSAGQARSDGSGALVAGAYRFNLDDPDGHIPVYWEYILGNWTSHRELLFPAGSRDGNAKPGENTAPYPVAFIGQYYSSGNGFRGALWPTPSSMAQILGTLGGDSSFAADDNVLGTIVGVSRPNGTPQDRAVRWMPPSYGIFDLNTRRRNDGWTLTAASGIDATGRIVGYMTRTVNRVQIGSGYALIPVGQ